MSGHRCVTTDEHRWVQAAVDCCVDGHVIVVWLYNMGLFVASATMLLADMRGFTFIPQNWGRHREVSLSYHRIGANIERFHFHTTKLGPT